jgi:oxygen-dependent protoporphyrinogen oxidase
VHETDLLISTLNPATLDPLLVSDQPLPHLTINPSTNVGVVNIVYPLPSRRIHPDGFGYLVPRAPEDDGLSSAIPGTSSIPNTSGVLGVIFDSTTLPVDATPNAAEYVTKLTIMLGGPHWTKESDIPTDPESLVVQAQEHLKRVFPVLRTVEPVAVRAWVQRQCIPTYLPGHGARLKELHQTLSEPRKEGSTPWAGKLVLAGSGYGGVGVNDCVGSAEGVVRELEKRWTSDSRGESGRPATGLERWETWE